jgi:hypothetical protein
MNSILDVVKDERLVEVVKQEMETLGLKENL